MLLLCPAVLRFRGSMEGYFVLICFDQVESRFETVETFVSCCFLETIVDISRKEENGHVKAAQTINETFGGRDSLFLQSPFEYL